MTMPELVVAQAAARAAGSILNRYHREGVVMRSKDVANLVSDADVEAERAIVEVIRSAYPGHEVLGEEGHQADVAAEHLWVVDPLDGTSNFAHKIPQFAVSIAYYRGGVAPVRGDPEPGPRRVARGDPKGGGAFVNGRQVYVAEDAALADTMVALGFYYDRGAMMEATLAALADFKRREVHGVRRFGAAALDLCMVGMGQLGVYFEYTLSPWDFAAGRLFVEEAGGKVTTARGEPLGLAKTSVLATNGRLHPAALEVVAAHHPGGPTP